MYKKIEREDINYFINVVGNVNVSNDPEKLDIYSHDEVSGDKYKYLPELIVFSENKEQISKIMEYCSKNKIPVTPRSAGTGLSGGAVPVMGGIVLSTEKMNRIVEFDEETLTITVEPGVIPDDIQKVVREKGLLYAGDPCSSDASFIGGNVAENAGGNKVIKYGATGNSVMALEAVLPDGSIEWFGGKLVKDVTGYDLVSLIVGSEGTLCIVTKIILKLIPLSKYIVDLLVPFKTIEKAIEFVPKMIIESRIIPTSIEFMDNSSLVLTEKFLNSTLPYSQAGAHLIIELEGNDKEILADEYEKIGKYCIQNGALEVFVADNKTTRNRIWKARKSIAEAISSLYKDFCMEDVVVPINRIPELMSEVKIISQKNDLDCINFGHAGDGNIHVTFLNHSRNRKEWENIIDITLKELYEKTFSLGGTLSGEHGIGLKRKPYLPIVMSKEKIKIMKGIKKVFDPEGILNPGKIF